MKTAFYDDVTARFKAAKIQFVRSNSSHDIYRTAGERPQNVVVPRKLDDKRLYFRILKALEVS